jgi:hypothetical protein
MITSFIMSNILLGKGPKMPPDQLPAIVPPGGGLTTPTDTYVVPVLIARAGDQAGWRYVEFFTANTRTPNTRRAYELHELDLRQ